jgi:exopolysaccharide production protein ExoQ
LQNVATLATVVVILGLFLLNRDRKVPSSVALWLPLVWLLIAGSRNVGEWMQRGAPTGAGDAYLEGNPLDRNLLSGMVALGLIILIQRRKTVLKLVSANIPLLLFFLYCGISVFWSDYPFVGFKRWIRALGDLVMVLIVLSDRDWFAARKRLFAWVAFILLPLSMLFIRYYSEIGRAYSTRDGTASWTGVATSKNELGMLCLVFGLASLARFLDVYRKREGARRWGVLIAHGTIVAMALWLIRMANSATSLACLLLGGGLLIMTTWKPLARKPALVTVLVVSMLFVAYAALFLNVGSGMVESLGRESTLTGRTSVWDWTLKLVENPLVGTGFESFWLGTRLDKMRELDKNLNQAHNGYLEIYLNLGWIGIILLSGAIIAGYRNIIKAFRRDPDTARLSLAYFVVTLAFNLTEGAFKMRSLIWISFLLAITAVPLPALPKIRSAGKPAPISPPPAYSPVAVTSTGSEFETIRRKRRV